MKTTVNDADFLEKSRDKSLPTIIFNVRCEPQISDYLALLRNYRSPNLIIVFGTRTTTFRLIGFETRRAFLSYTAPPIRMQFFSSRPSFRPLGYTTR